MIKSKYLASDLRLHNALMPFGVFKDLPNFDHTLENVLSEFDEFFKPMLDLRQDDVSYPPSNTKKTADGYLLELAIAGYKKEDISVTEEDDILTISAVKQKKEEETDNFIYRGISSKSFSRMIKLGKSAEVKNVSLVDGLLSIEIVENKSQKTSLKHEIK